MKGTLRKMASVILIMAMVITSVSLDGLQVSAATKKPTKITLNAKSKTLTVGKSFQLKVKSVKPTKASKAVTYKSSNKKVATVSSKGKIVAKKAGKTTITVTSKSNKKVKATCKITVKKKPTPTKKPTATVAPTATPEPTATVAPTATPKPTMAPGDSYGELHSPIVDEEGNVTYSCIYFGNYPQSDITGQTKEPIKWRVLSINGNDAFLVADQNLDVMEYNKTHKEVTWETCTMRSWLNGYGSSSNGDEIDYSSDNFIDRAFNDTEQAAILTTNVVNDDNPEYGTEGGKNTQDKIFLLSIDEVSNSAYGFLPYADDSNDYVNDKARQRTNTAYVNNGGIIQSSKMKNYAEYDVKEYGGYEWWLRSPGNYSVCAANVNRYGDVGRNGPVVGSGVAVCPALHINLSSSSTWSMAESVTTATVAPTATPEPTATIAPTATPEPTATVAPTATPKPTMAPGDSYGELNSPIVDEEGNVTYSCIYFGNYPQSDITGETKEPIKWRVLSVKGDDAFLVADQNLDVMEYNKTYKKEVTWETCTMRSWLNGYGSSSNGDGIDYSSDNFIDRAFNDTEQAAILTTNVVNDNNLEYGTEGGNNTQDKIFLLSIDEVSNSAYGFLPCAIVTADDSNDYVHDKARQRTNTAYVNNGGIVQDSWVKDNAEDYVKKYGGYWWWLRSPGECSSYAAHVDGAVLRGGNHVRDGIDAVCPALHINLSSSSTWSMAESVTVQRFGLYLD